MYYLCISTITWIKNNFIVFTESTLTPIQSELKASLHIKEIIFQIGRSINISMHIDSQLS